MPSLLCTNIAGGADAVTATFQKSVSSFGVVYVHEYAGISAVNPIGATAAAIGSSALMNSGSVTTSANDLIFGAGVSANSVTTAGTGFTARDLTYGNITEDRIATAAGSYTATATQNGKAWAMQIAAFRAANRVNQAPLVSAGSDQTITLPTNAVALAGAATDDGLPWPPGALTYSWSAISGPGPVTFSAPTALGTTAMFTTAGNYSLRLSVSDSALTTTSDVHATVNPAGGGISVTMSPSRGGLSIRQAQQ